MPSVRRLFIRLALFALPLAAIFGAVIGVAVYSGEAMPYRMVLALQAADHSIIYRRRNMAPQQSLAYKLAALRMRPPPAVLMIGSSRVLVFHSEFFNDPDNFYNAGMPGAYLDGVAALLDSLTPETAPDVLLIGVDAFWFNARLDVAQRRAGTFTAADDDWVWVGESTRATLREIARGEYGLSDMFARRDPIGGGIALGFDAQETGIGYRWDGSMQTNPTLMAHAASQPPRESYRLYPPTQAGNTVIEHHFEALNIVLARAEAMGITVIGFMPPYMPEMYVFMHESGRHAYLDEARARLGDMFAQRGLAFFDFSDISTLGVGAEEMMDFVHPSERLAARMLSIMAREVPALRTYVDPARLEHEFVNLP